MARRTRRLDARCPINWEWDGNTGLIGQWAITPMSGWSGGDTLRDLVRGAKQPHDGTLTGGTIWVAGPNGLGALSFDGANDETVGADISGMTGDVSCAVECWIYPTSSSDMAFSSFGQFTGLGVFAPFLNIRGAGVVSVEYGGGNPAISAAPALAINQWHHVACMKSPGVISSTSRFVVDGIPYGTAGGSSSSTPNIGTGAGFRWGSFAGAGNFWSGRIGPGSFYNRAVSDSEGVVLYDQSRRGNPDRWRWIRPITYSFPAAPAVARRWLLVRR